MRHIGASDIHSALERLRDGRRDKYLAMYSSVLDGIVTDPALMTVPVDDHVVHRGDGVFETMKCVDGGIYNLRAHLKRLITSANALAYKPMPSLSRMSEIITATVRAGKTPDCSIRTLLSRGPGSMGVNPYDCPKPQLYVVVSRLPRPFMEVHPEGARVKISSIPAKSHDMAVIKTCNYLPNVMMAKEAADSNAHFAVGFDEKRHLTEGATENVVIITRRRELWFPRTDRILSGTTMLRALDLANKLVSEGVLTDIVCRHILRRDLVGAAEILLVGTSINVVAVTMLDGKPTAGGKPGPVYRGLSDLLLRDMRVNKRILTPVFGE